MSQYHELISSRLSLIRERLNELLSGKRLRRIEDSLMRMNRGGALPAWFEQLASRQTLPNLDGKTIGSVVEKLLACVLEKDVLDSKLELHVNPAKGVDIPELGLGVKSPSENFCTSEPYFSAYERLVGNENDALVLLTDYQSSKKSAGRNNGLRLQILDVKYLRGAEIADRHLCEVAEGLKKVYAHDESMLRRAIHFLAYVNQGDWEAARLLDLIRRIVVEGANPDREYVRISEDFRRRNHQNECKGRDLIPDEQLDRLRQASSSCENAVLQAEGWVLRTLNENWHSPSQSVWTRICTHPLEGKIGMSFALQWRYNFGPIFRRESGRPGKEGVTDDSRHDS